MVSLLPVRSWVNGRCCSPATNANIAVDRHHRQWSSSASSAGVILVVRGQMRSAKLQASSSSSSKVGVIIVDAVSLGVRLMVSKVGSRSLGQDRWVKAREQVKCVRRLIFVRGHALASVLVVAIIGCCPHCSTSITERETCERAAAGAKAG